MVHSFLLHVTCHLTWGGHQGHQENSKHNIDDLHAWISTGITAGLESAAKNKAGNPDIYSHFMAERTALRRGVTLLLSKDTLFAAPWDIVSLQPSGPPTMRHPPCAHLSRGVEGISRGLCRRLSFRGRAPLHLGDDALIMANCHYQSQGTCLGMERSQGQV